jgi:nitronate monooxygenase
MREFDATAGAPVGVGFITWSLARQPELLDLALARKPKAVFLSFGDMAPFAKRIRTAGIPLFAQVQTVAGAREAVAQGADVIVAQGAEAGGHGGTRGTLALIPAVRDVIGERPLVAAGGIADGRGLSAALMLGSDAVLCGTAFYAAEESLAHPRARQAAVEACGDETVRSSVFDAARGIDWPAPWTLRARNNLFHDHWAQSPGAMTAADRQAYAEAALQGDPSTAAVIVGEAADLVRTVEPAARIAARIAGDARLLLSDASRFSWFIEEGMKP